MLGHVAMYVAILSKPLSLRIQLAHTTHTVCMPAAQGNIRGSMPNLLYLTVTIIDVFPGHGCGYIKITVGLMLDTSMWDVRSALSPTSLPATAEPSAKPDSDTTSRCCVRATVGLGAIFDNCYCQLVAWR